MLRNKWICPEDYNIFTLSLEALNPAYIITHLVHVKVRPVKLWNRKTTLIDQICIAVQNHSNVKNLEFKTTVQCPSLFLHTIILRLNLIFINVLILLKKEIQIFITFCSCNFAKYINF